MSRNFDGTDDFISFGDIDAIDSATSITVMLWLRHDTATADQGVFHKRDSVGSGILLFRDEVGAVSGRTDCYTWFVSETAGAGGTTTRIESATNSGSDGVWRHIACVCTVNNATGLRFYVNGVEDANSPVSTANIDTIDGLTAAFELGRRETAATYLDGQIAHLHVFNRALSAGEIKQIMHYPGSLRRSLLLYAPLWGGSPEKDYSGNKNNSISVTGVTMGSTDPPINRIFGAKRPRLWYSGFSTATIPNNVISTKLNVLNSSKLSMLDRNKLTLVGF